MSYFEKCCENPQKAPEFCKEGLQHYSNLIMASVNPIMVGDIPFIAAAMEECAKSVSRMVPKKLKPLKRTLSEAAQSDSFSIRVNDLSPEEVEDLMQMLFKTEK